MSDYRKSYQQLEWSQTGAPQASDTLARDKFTAEFMSKLAYDIKPLLISDCDALSRSLRELAASYIGPAMRGPFGLPGGASLMSYDQQGRQLRGQFINPITELIASLDLANNPVLSEFPEIMHSDRPQKEALVSELKVALERALELEASIYNKSREHRGMDLRYELYHGLADVFEEHFPSQKAAPESHQTERKQKSEFAMFVEECVDHMFPKAGLFSLEQLGRALAPENYKPRRAGAVRATTNFDKLSR